MVVPLNTSTVDASLSTLVKLKVEVVSFVKSSVEELPVSLDGANVITGLETSLSMIVPVPLIPPIANVKVSFDSLAVSLTVGTLAVKFVTPAGTVIVPLLLFTTPFVNVMPEALKSAELVVILDRVKVNVCTVAVAAESVTPKDTFCPSVALESATRATLTTVELASPVVVPATLITEAARSLDGVDVVSLPPVLEVKLLFVS
ncbi:hypothetical protein MSP8887_02100 [Marinomonas spartinae]|nr:hypothetical protein MSP8887_02100 [Marinomonas spartinae]